MRLVRPNRLVEHRSARQNRSRGCDSANSDACLRRARASNFALPGAIGTIGRDRMAAGQAACGGWRGRSGVGGDGSSAAESSRGGDGDGAGAGGGTHRDRAQRLAEQILVAATRIGPAGWRPAADRAPAQYRSGRHPARRSGMRWRSSRRRAVSPARWAGVPSCTTVIRAAGRAAAGCDRGHPRPGWTMSPPAADFAPADVMTIRRLLEPPAMSLGRFVGDRRRSAGDAALSGRRRRSGHVRGVRGLGPGPAPVHHGGQPQPAARRAVPGDRGGPARPGLGRPQAAEHDATAPDPLPVRSPRHRRGAEFRDSGQAVEAMRRHLARVQEHLNVTDPAAGVSWQ